MKSSGLLPLPLPNSAAPAATSTSGGQMSPKSAKTRQRRKKNKGRVHWDEQAIVEHDKERGTRQKIDEPDTPWVRSPQTASDCEPWPASSDNDRHISFRPPVRITFNPCENSTREISPVRRDVNPEVVAHCLDAWVRSGATRAEHRRGASGTSSDGGDVADHSNLSSACSSRCSSSAPHRRPSSDGGSHRGSERHISIDVELLPKPTSDDFKAKRTQHYNEMAAIKAFKQQEDEEECLDSDTSDEDKRYDLITINTNTNINTTANQADVCTRPRKYSVASSMDADSSAAGSDRDNRRRASSDRESTRSQRSTVSFSGGESGIDSSDGDRCTSEGKKLGSIMRKTGSDRESNRSQRSSVSFSGGESGNESSEDFRNLRRNHSAAEWKRHEPHAANSLETNTNTNLNAGATSATAHASGAAECCRNPMEAGRAPVRFSNDDHGASSSEEFRSLRQHHYDEIAAVRRFRTESGGEDEDTEEDSSSSSSSEAAPAQEPLPPGSSGNPMEDEELPSGAIHGTHMVIEAATNPANPMEPRDTGLAFSIDGQLLPSSPVEPAVSDAQSPERASWRQKRNAHYNEMAAALRQAPPPSSEEEDEEGGQTQESASTSRT